MVRHFSLLLLVFFSSISSARASEPKLDSIFNGKDFQGWKEPQGNSHWTIHEGVLTAKSDSEQRGSILWTEKDYRDFVMQFDFRFGEGTVDSGVFLRTDKDQIQIGISGSKKRDMTCSPYIANEGYPVEAEGVKDLLKLDDWNTVKIRVEGKVYSIWLNGRSVLTYSSDSAIEQGPIGLQLHQKVEMHIDFRHLTLAELPPSTRTGSDAKSSAPVTIAYGNQVAEIPGTIEAENFDEGAPNVAYADREEKNLGAEDYRGATQVDLEKRDDASGGYGVGWTKKGEWLLYSVLVKETAIYNIEISVACDKQGGTFHLEFNGKDVTGPIQIPDTGGWTTLQTITKEGLKLNKGLQKMKMVMDTENKFGNVGDIDCLKFSAATQ